MITEIDLLIEDRYIQVAGTRNHSLFFFITTTQATTNNIIDTVA